MLRVALTVTVCACYCAETVRAQAPDVAPDEIFYNGKIITVDRDFRIEQAVAVKAGRFLAVGTNARVRALSGPRTRLTDLQGHAVIPGLIDSHNHQYMAAMLERGVDLGGLKSLEEMFGRL